MLVFQCATDKPVTRRIDNYCVTQQVVVSSGYIWMPVTFLPIETIKALAILCNQIMIACPI